MSKKTIPIVPITELFHGLESTRIVSKSLTVVLDYGVIVMVIFTFKGIDTT
jgi:hypothetical protein